MNTKQATVAVYNGHHSVNEAVAKLREAGYDMTKLSIIGRDYHTPKTIAGYYSSGDQMKMWGGLSAFWDALWDVLAGSGLFTIPGFGPLLFAGPFVSTMVSVLKQEGTVGESGVLGIALAAVGIPSEQSHRYQTEIKKGNFILIAHGSAEEVGGVEKMLATQPKTILAGKAKQYTYTLKSAGKNAFYQPFIRW